MDALSLVMDAVTAGIGVGGLLLAGLANKRAKEANRHAEMANDLATQSLAQAEEANRVAQEGNHIARDANTIAERALTAATDHVQYDWRVEAEGDPPAVRVVNDSAHPATHVTVVVTDGHEVITTATAETVPVLGQVPLDLHGTLQKHLEHARQRPTVLISGGTSIIRGPHRFDLRLTITADTQAGVTHSDVIKQRFTVRQGQIKIGG